MPSDADTSAEVTIGPDAVRRLQAYAVFSSGSSGIDRLIGGGYRVGRSYVLFGKSNSGKTQLAMQAALSAARQGKRALFIDTEGSFRPERLEGIAEARGWNPKGLLERIVYLRADSYPEQMEAIEAMAKREATSACRLVVIDTLTRNFSLGLPGSTNMASRQAEIDIHLSEIARDAVLNERAYVLTNRVTYGASADIGIGGKTVEQLVHDSLRLEKENGAVRVTLLSSGESAEASLGKAGVD